MVRLVWGIGEKRGGEGGGGDGADFGFEGLGVSFDCFLDGEFNL